MIQVKAVLPYPMGYRRQTLQFEEVQCPAVSVSGVVSFVTDPDLARLLEALGAVSMRGTFGGLQTVGHSYVLLLPSTTVLIPANLDRQTACDLFTSLPTVLCTRVK